MERDAAGQPVETEAALDESLACAAIAARWTAAACRRAALKAQGAKRAEAMRHAAHLEAIAQDVAKTARKARANLDGLDGWQWNRVAALEEYAARVEPIMERLRGPMWPDKLAKLYGVRI